MRWFKIPISKGVIRLISHLRLYDKSEIAAQRQKIICFYETHGESATKQAFRIGKYPRINGVVERFNRTLKEDFIEPNLHLIYNQKQYNKNLAKYMIYYNCQRPHESLNNMTPTTFLIQKGGISKMLRSYTFS